MPAEWCKKKSFRETRLKNARGGKPTQPGKEETQISKRRGVVTGIASRRAIGDPPQLWQGGHSGEAFRKSMGSKLKKAYMASGPSRNPCFYQGSEAHRTINEKKGCQESTLPKVRRRVKKKRRVRLQPLNDSSHSRHLGEGKKFEWEATGRRETEAQKPGVTQKKTKDTSIGNETAVGFPEKREVKKQIPEKKRNGP